MQTLYTPDSLGWQSRTVGAKTDSEGKKWSSEVNLQGGDWMLEFKFNHSNALHNSRLCPSLRSLGFVHLLKQSSGRWGGRGERRGQFAG